MLHKQPRTLNSKVKVQKGWTRINRRLVREKVTAVVPAQTVLDQSDLETEDDDDDAHDNGREVAWFMLEELDGGPTRRELCQGGGWRRVDSTGNSMYPDDDDDDDDDDAEENDEEIDDDAHDTGREMAWFKSEELDGGPTSRELRHGGGWRRVHVPDVI